MNTENGWFPVINQKKKKRITKKEKVLTPRQDFFNKLQLQKL